MKPIDDEVRHLLAEVGNSVRQAATRTLKRCANQMIKALEEYGTVDLGRVSAEARAAYRRNVANAASMLVALFPAVIRCLPDVEINSAQVVGFLLEADWAWREPVRKKKAAAKRKKG